MTKRNRAALLDVNILIALLDPEHLHHDRAHSWFHQNSHHGWATCPITENGCLRIMGKLYAPFGLTLPQVAETLNGLLRMKGHRFWPDQNSIVDPKRFALAKLKPKTLTDAYLLDLACANDGRLVTFDQGIDWQWAANAREEHLSIIT